MNADSVHQLLGAYLLGGLEPDEARAFEDHLAACADCRGELEELESLPALLDAVPAADAVALTVAGGSQPLAPLETVPPSLLVDLSTRRRKSRRRWAAVVGAVAAACLALGFLSGPLLNQPPKPDATYSVQSGDGLQLTVGMVKKTWGTELAVEGRSMPLEGTLYLWVKGRDGAEERTCGWTATPSGRIKITGATPVQLTGIAGVELRDDSDKTVASISVP
ncbi:zf-HC2 domain-containing protein [Arthrobacter sp. TES]|uniref:Zf-HC2 domain-containing protein n=1 Tax=Paenarthrobacter ureafaciens TaxID=37931 RepID=A0AAX3EGD4_PAEUR|nr:MULTISPECIES: zf-HC2 domain-containing protein [Paenarthrobacter]AOY69762.1 anti-sigma factor [Arthrobacter sp. ZXY-2]ERI37191.1 anti-sigma factor [Arthrobacter sp. AK-YN10]NKR09877.1 anti-sigma factor [Arthrobacter sp. M5]NKR17548.1 anti-sigma factor [Arthrobacter sp. M6]OEH56887.1 anti-sigma factor [Arthrobacter sp. D4]OEH63855.1 anti-sigma factor [Arthrobacter sp. D2]QOI62102.1 zf-HC2 domain-containing protein [Arthrobacter sp. TES]